MIDHVKETFNVAFNNSRDSSSASDCTESGVTTTVRAEAMGRSVKFRLQDSFHNHIHGLLDDFITRGSDT